jgi:hypothetical protein
MHDMDANKLEKLRQLPYSIRRCCGSCLHNMGFKDTFWTTCSVNDYEHLKHTETGRQLSIYMFGCCPKFSWNPDVKNLGVWIEFLEK